MEDKDSSADSNYLGKNRAAAVQYNNSEDEDCRSEGEQSRLIHINLIHYL